jgi:2-oxoglutarate dehydrogenase E2 component (dihydrolipoamide succinyltransferase)
MATFLDIQAPANAEGTKASVLKWCKSPGDTVSKDEPLLELETDKVTVEIASPEAGVLAEILKQETSEVRPGEVLARLELKDIAFAAKISAVPEQSSQVSSAVPRKMLSPAVRRMFSTYGLSSAQIHGSGRNGRITVSDVSRELKVREAQQSKTVKGELHLAPPPSNVTSITGVAEGSERRPHSAMRRRIAEHMRASMAAAPHVTTVFEADLTRVIAHRKKFADASQRDEVPLTLSAYFLAACARALQAVPEVNSTYHTDALELHHDVNVGIATALGNEGLIVPVLHRVQDMSLLGIARKLNQLVSAARAGKLSPSDVRGGTFTVSNHGVSGSILASPIIINQPQVAILGIGKVERRVMVESVAGEDVFKVRSKCYVTLTIDHRALDAFQANAFLTTFVRALEQWPDDSPR